MVLSIKRVLIASTFLALSFPQEGLSTEKQIDNGNGTMTVTLSDKVPTLEPLSWVDLAKMPQSFVTSLFQPFIDGAPTALEAFQEQGKKIKEEGIVYYTLSTMGQIGKAALENPLDFVTAAGAIALGWTNVAEYSTLVPLTVAAAVGLKQGGTLYSLASNVNGQTVLDKTLKIALIGLAVHAVASTPCSFALSTLTPGPGPQFQINTNPVDGNNPTNTFNLGKDASGSEVLGSTWVTAATGQVTGRLYYGNGTMITPEFTISTSVPTTTPNPNSAVFQCNTPPCNWFTTWADGVSMLVQISSPTGAVVAAPFRVNPFTSTSQGGACAAGLTGGKGLTAWVNSTAGSYNLVSCSFNSDGTGLDNPSSLTQTSTPLGAPLATNDFITWGGNALYGNQLTQSGVASGSPVTIDQSGSQLGAAIPVDLTGGGVMTIYASGSNTVGNVIQSGVVGSQFTAISGCGSAAITPLSNGGVFLACQNGTIVGETLDATGTLSSNLAVIPSNGNGIAPSATFTSSGAFVTWRNALSNLIGRPVSISGSSPTTTGTPSGTTGTPSGTTGTPSGTTGTPSGTTGTPSGTTGTPSGTTGTPSGTTGTPSGTTGNPTPVPAPSSAAGVGPSLFVSLSASLIYSVIEGIYNR